MNDTLMIDIIYKIVVYKNPITKLDKIKLNLFGIGKYYYWLEYRIDENRFWYCEQKGKRKKYYNSHHTKQDLKGSIKIMNGIIDRSISYDYIVDIVLDCNIANYIATNIEITDEEIELVDNIILSTLK